MSTRRRDRATIYVLLFIAALIILLFVIAPLPARGQSSPAADQLYLQTAGHTASGSTIFATELQITNESDDAIDVSITFAPSNATDDDPRYDFAQYLPRRITLAPREYREVRDERLAAMVPTGIGMFIFDACKSGADCSTQYDLVHGLRVEKVPNVRARRPVSVTARVYSYFGAASGTRGESYQSVPWFDAWSVDGAAAGLDRPFLASVRSDAHYRTNVSFANASGYSTIALRATLYDGLGQSRGSYDLSLGPLESRLVGAEVMFPALVESRLNRRLIRSPWIRVEQVAVTPNALAAAQVGVALGCADGCSGFLVQGSMIDNLTGDATRLVAQSEMAEGGLNGKSERSQSVQGKEAQAPRDAVLQRTIYTLADTRVQGLPLARTVERVTDPLRFEYLGVRCSIERSADDYLVRTADGRPWLHVGIGELTKAREMCGAMVTAEVR